MAALETSEDCEWRDPPDELSLTGEEVHVWRASLACEEPLLRGLRATLAPDEEARAGRFHFARDRNHFAAARGLLRLILARYLNRPPTLLRFGYSSYGKPFLEGECGPGGLRFNVSHAHGMALFAVARGREVGVDIEHARDDFEHLDLAGRFFSAREVETLKALPPEAQTQAFFNCWTRKEAYIKARGEGLSHPLDEFDVALAPGEAAALTCTRSDPAEVTRWAMRELFPGHGFQAAVVAEGGAFRLSCWQWREGEKLAG
jgi:4'-phosphopantetheinyl transferase